MLRDILLGFARIHILYHAGRGPVYGAWLSEELARHGYELGPGTLYPMLHGLEAAGYLASEKRVTEGRVRRYYTLTPSGRRALAEARAKALELVAEITEGESPESQASETREED
ncbi:MAG TPA: PadR family transcriptional regulator [Chloroflexi bacterium]|nr:PadR family transcriptional regulator [Chloroflexota bacterium]